MPPAAPPHASARDRLLAAADELFYAEGIHSVGIDRVIDRASVAKATKVGFAGLVHRGPAAQAIELGGGGEDDDGKGA